MPQTEITVILSVVVFGYTIIRSKKMIGDDMSKTAKIINEDKLVKAVEVGFKMAKLQRFWFATFIQPIKVKAVYLFLVEVNQITPLPDDKLDGANTSVWRYGFTKHRSIMTHWSAALAHQVFNENSYVFNWKPTWLLGLLFCILFYQW